MFEFPLWIAQSKDKIIIYDSNFKIIYETPYNLTQDKRLKQLVYLSNKHKDLSLLNTIQ